MVNETKKIMGDDSIQVTATTVRVPVFIGHAEAVNVELEKGLSPKECRKILQESPGVVVVDDPVLNCKTAQPQVPFGPCTDFGREPGRGPVRRHSGLQGRPVLQHPPGGPQAFGAVPDDADRESHIIDTPSQSDAHVEKL